MSLFDGELPLVEKVFGLSNSNCPKTSSVLCSCDFSIGVTLIRWHSLCFTECPVLDIQIMAKRALVVFIFLCFSMTLYLWIALEYVLIGLSPDLNTFSILTSILLG